MNTINSYVRSPFRTFINKTFPKILLAGVCIIIFLLLLLLTTIINSAFGYIVLENKVSEAEIGLKPLGSGNNSTAINKALNENLSRGQLRKLNAEHAIEGQSIEKRELLVRDFILAPEIMRSYTLLQSLFSSKQIAQELSGTEYLQFRSWLSYDFLTSTQNSNVLRTGIRTALLGSLWIMFLTILITLPIGIGTAIHLQEYASKSRLNKLIEVNVYNLSGVPSIVYGLLGLTVFVRIMEPISSGAIFGIEAGNGRTIISASLTLSLLVMPIVIINTKEAMAGVAQNLKDASYALGASKWQTIWHHTLPYCMDRILTGVILAISRAVGETAPLVVIGASTFLAIDPSGLFSKFTVLPIQVYQWSARPQAEFKHVAAATIIVLLILMMGMNIGAILLRNSIRKKKIH